MSESWVNAKRSAVDVIVMFVVCFFSLSILVYVAEGDAERVYLEFFHGAAYSQGQLVQNDISAFLRKNLPLSQFAGFSALTDPLLQATSPIGTVTVIDDMDEVIFNAVGHDAASHDTVTIPNTRQLAVDKPLHGFEQEIRLPLRNKFEKVGDIVLKLKIERIMAEVGKAFRPLWITVLLCSFGFGILTFATRHVAWDRKRVWTATAFMVTFIVLAGVVTSTLLALYTTGATAKGTALLSSLSGRLKDVTAYDIDFDQLSGVDHLFADYTQLNPDVSSIGLLVNGLAKVHSDPHKVASPWVPPAGSFEYVKDISQKAGFQSTTIALTMQRDVVYRQITDCVRNIMALFVASALLAYFSMSVARSLQQAREGKINGLTDMSDFGIGLIKPVFFLATFIENLNYAFLPQYVQKAAQDDGVPLSYTSSPFIAFYLCFALSLLPAERIARSLGPHKLILGGLLLVATGLLVLTGQLGFASIIVARALSGVGQGLVFIGVQSYILDATSAESRTRGASVIVIGFQAGMMSGMAIGSLLVSQLGPSGVFHLGAAIALVTAVYTLAIVPKVSANDDRRESNNGQAWRNIVLTLRDPEFLRTIWLIGLPAKAVLTGVILFALPLLLMKQGFRQEDIGQITMTYGAAVIVASAWISSKRNRMPGTTGSILVLGAVFSGAGLLLISTVGWHVANFDISAMLPTAAIIIVGATVVGIGHGLINAPVITQVTESRIAAQLGAGPVAATYRLLERAGHTIGPMIVGQIVLISGSGALALGWIGGALIAFGMIFALLLQDTHNNTLKSETA